jgi:hypothetical protein
MKEVDNESRDPLQRVIDVVIERTGATDERVDAFQERFETSHNVVVTILDSVVKEVADLRTEYHAVVAALSRVEQQGRQIPEVVTPINELRSRVNDIDGRLTKLEVRDHDA